MREAFVFALLLSVILYPIHIHLVSKLSVTSSGVVHVIRDTLRMLLGTREETSNSEVANTLVLVSGGIILGRDHETASFGSPSVYRFNYVDKLLLIIHGPVDLIVISSSQVNHDMLITIEKHDSARIIQLVHLIEIGDLSDVAQVYHRKVLDFLRDSV